MNKFKEMNFPAKTWLHSATPQKWAWVILTRPDIRPLLSGTAFEPFKKGHGWVAYYHGTAAELSTAHCGGDLPTRSDVASLRPSRRVDIHEPQALPATRGGQTIHMFDAGVWPAYYLVHGVA